MIERVVFSTGAAVGGAGVATATGYSVHVSGKVLSVHVAYIDAPPAGTTDFLLSDENDPSSTAILQLANAATDVRHFPRRQIQNHTGNDMTYDGTYPVVEPVPVHGRLEAIIDQANAGDSCTVIVWLEVY